MEKLCTACTVPEHIKCGLMPISAKSSTKLGNWAPAPLVQQLHRNGTMGSDSAVICMIPFGIADMSDKFRNHAKGEHR